jgi:CubicO group peptidase (beta-lactamase class C family)
MNQWRSALALCVALLPVGACADDRGFTLDEANGFRHAWTLENWDKGGPLMRYVLLNMPEFWRHSLIPRGGDVRPLEHALRPEVAQFMATTEAGKKPLLKYVNESTVDGVAVLHRGRIVFEAYPRMRRNDLHNYMSVSKAMSATLIAILEDRGLIDVRKPVDAYLPALAGSGWAGVPVRDILDMASGIGCLEGEPGAYTDPATCYYQYEASLGWLRPSPATPESPYAHITSLKSHRPSGEAFEYTSVNTFVLGWLAQAVTGRPYAELLSTEIWQKMGAESAAVISAPNHGIPVVHAGVSSTLRDMARFGWLFTPSGRAGAKPVISAQYLDRIQHQGRPALTRPARDQDAREWDGEPVRHNSYQWDLVMDDGDFFKGGFGGQGLYVSPSRDLVIAFFGTFGEDGKEHEMSRIARQLAKSGLFGQ